MTFTPLPQAALTAIHQAGWKLVPGRRNQEPAMTTDEQTKTLRLLFTAARRTALDLEQKGHVTTRQKKPHQSLAYYTCAEAFRCLALEIRSLIPDSEEDKQ